MKFERANITEKFFLYNHRPNGRNKIAVMNNIEERLKKVLMEYGIEQEKVSKDSDYYFDLNLDMLDLLRIAGKIRKEFRVSIPDNEIFRMERISDTIYFIEQKSKFTKAYC